jgi:predicted MPP superfamily phosphohydrolase
MIYQLLFWVYVFFQFQIFIYLTNRVGIRQHERANELLWTSFFLGAQILPSVFFCAAWDFTLGQWPLLPLYWKLYSTAVALWVFALWVDHVYWILFRKKRVHFRWTYRRSAKMPKSLQAPFGFLKYVGFKNQIYDLEVVEYEVQLPHWPKEFSGLSLVQLSDIHFGKYINPTYLKVVVERAKKIKPDLYLLTGDFISFKKDIPRIIGLFKGLHAPLGVYAVLGNHDIWADGKALQKGLEKDGIRVLRNEVVYHKRKGKTLAIMGVDDIWVGERNDEPLLKAKGDAKLLLAHQPDHFYLAEQTKAHLQLSGHCHGGQICFPFIGPLVVPADEGRKYAGGFIREGDTTMFIHRGVGCYPPLRTYCSPEIVKIVLR